MVALKKDGTPRKKCGRPKGIPNRTTRVFTEQELSYLSENYHSVPYKVIAVHLGTNIKRLVHEAKKLGLGEKTNLGRKKLGDLPTNPIDRYITKPIGSEMTMGGDVYVKVDNKRGSARSPIGSHGAVRNWKRKSHIVWEQHHGAVPQGMRLLHLDGDLNNNNIDNLVPITCANQMLLAREGFHSDNPQFTKAAVQWCKLKEALKNSRGGGKVNVDRFIVTARRVDNGEAVIGSLHTYSNKVLVVSHEVIEFDDECFTPEWWWEVDPATVKPLALPVKRKPHVVGVERCPTCDAAFVAWAGRTKYCGHCGQRLEWTP